MHTPDQRALSEDVRCRRRCWGARASDWPLGGSQVATDPAGISSWAVPIYPRYPGAEQLGPAGAHLLPDPQLLQRLTSGSALIKLEQTGALRRCPPALLPAPRPVARPRAREARQLPHVLLPRARLRRRARWLGGAAVAPLHFAGPAPPRWCGSAASRGSRRASAAGRPPCPWRPARPGS